MRVLTTPPTCDTHELVRAQCQVAHHAARGVFQLRRPLHEELGLAQRRETDGRESDGRVVGAIHVNGSRLCGFGCATALFHSLGCRFASKMNISATSSSSSAPSSWICPSAGWNLLAATFGCVLRPCCSEPSGFASLTEDIAFVDCNVRATVILFRASSLSLSASRHSCIRGHFYERGTERSHC